MKLTAQIQILPDMEQKQRLLATMEHFNQAATFAAKTGFEAKKFGRWSIQNLCYREIKKRFGLNAQLTVRAIGKAVECFKRDKKRCPEFRPRSAVVYDSRILTIKPDCISLSTLNGRLKVPFVCGDYHKRLLLGKRGEADLVYRNGKFLLLVSVEVAERPEYVPKDVIGVDLGIKNIAVDSDGTVYSGDVIETCRQRNQRLRSVLQSVGTRSAKRHLKKNRRRESNYRRDVNHCISKELVQRAQGTRRGIALEDLKGIRKRVTVRKAQRAKHSGWSFWQLRSFVEYKAQREGVPVFLVNPRGTSRTCPECGVEDKKNRKSRDEFLCQHCGYSSEADFVAARNIRCRALVNAPIVGRGSPRTCKPPAFSGR